MTDVVNLDEWASEPSYRLPHFRTIRVMAGIAAVLEKEGVNLDQFEHFLNVWFSADPENNGLLILEAFMFTPGKLD
jgi:hypothetical protein